MRRSLVADLKPAPDADRINPILAEIDALVQRLDRALLSTVPLLVITELLAALKAQTNKLELLRPDLVNTFVLPRTSWRRAVVLDIPAVPDTIEGLT